MEYIIFDWKEDAHDWTVQCANWGPFTTIRQLCVFLAGVCLTQYMAHRMNDHQVVRTAASDL